MLRVVPLNVAGPNGTITACALLDGGSTITLIESSLARKLGLSGKSLEMTMRGVHGGDLKLNTQRVCFDVSGPFGKEKIEHAIIIPKLDLPCQTLSLELAKRVKEQENIDLAPFRNAPLCILVGQDNWQLIMSDESRRLNDSGLVLSHSRLGWAVHGYEIGEWGTNHSNIIVHETCNALNDSGEAEPNGRLDELMENYFALESLGVSNKTVESSDDGRARKILESTTRKIGKVWESGLLWGTDVMPATDGKVTALKRLHSLEKKLDGDPQFAASYYAEMDRLIENGYVEKVNKPSGSRLWYLPHFGVKNPNKPGKVRIVFDAAAKTNGVCLNDLLLTGPDLLESLIGVLLRFRQYPYAIKADIKDMFLRIQVRKEDRSAQSFLYRGADRHRAPDTYESVSLVFGAKSSPCTAIFVKNKNAERFRTRKPEAAKSIKINSYMDDYLVSVRTLEEARRLVRDVTLINGEANFSMHGWASNDSRVVEQLGDERKLGEAAQASLGGENDRLLGSYWNRKADTLSFNVGFDKIRADLAAGTSKPTKREFYSIVMSVYDPLGILGPFTVQAKCIIKDLWLSGISWDTKIRDEEHQQWLAWLENLRKVTTYSVPRCFIPPGTDYVRSELHVFCDASLSAYAAVIYLRTELSNGNVHLSLIMSKTRVAPVKPTTVPRLELQAALLGAKTAATVEKELEIKISKRVFWSDSSTVIQWIRSGPRQKQIFVANRLGEINELTKTTEWRWVPTDQNPADCATRPTDKLIQALDRWCAGPDFLVAPPDTWPREKVPSKSETRYIANLETKKQFICAALSFEEKPSGWEKIAGWEGLIIWAENMRAGFRRWRLRASRRRNKSKLKEARKSARRKHHLLALKKRDEVESNTWALEKYWYRRIQEECFSKEMEALSKGKAVNKDSKIASLSAYLDGQGILRAKGRVTTIDGVEFENTPIILDAKHFATKLLIAKYHKRYNHANNETVVNEIRQQFYIFGLRARLRWLAKQCLMCRRERAKPCNPPMADLPKARVAHGLRPFTHCGLDYFGPMSVRVGRRTEKRWGVLFTCMTTRAVHIEVAHTLTASSTILALQRLAARRGCPSFIYSDNGTNFTRADKDLKDAINAIDKERQERFAARRKIVWKFNPPSAPHMGGAWERLVRSVKKGLAHALKDDTPPDEVLITVLIEIEHMINSRPLTHVPVDPQDEEALTPNHFLIGSSSGHLRLEKYENEITRPRWQFEIAQKLLQRYWRRWLREYLPTLIPKKKWFAPSEQLKVGDVVLIVDYQTTRNAWSTGRIIEVMPARDGVVRVAKVRVQKTDYIRPVHKLVKIFSPVEVKN